MNSGTPSIKPWRPESRNFNSALLVTFKHTDKISSSQTVRTTIVRCGQFRLDGTLAKPPQQVPKDGPLVVPLATLDSELQPVEIIQDAVDCFDIYLSVKLLNLHCVMWDKYIYIYIILTECEWGCVWFDNDHPQFASDYKLCTVNINLVRPVLVVTME